MKHKITDRLIITTFLVIGILLVWIACNKGFDRVVKQKNYQDTTSAIARDPHVLYIVIDGARGQSVRDAQPPNIMGLTNNAIYCWNDVSDTSASKLASWADLLTGVHKDKHKVLNGDLSQSDLTDYPVFFNYIKKRDSAFRITAFSSSDSIKSLISGADVNETFQGNDAATAKAALEEINRDSSHLVFVEFAGVDEAGSQYGYDLSVPQYKAAILQTDDYIGEMLAAIRKHKDYAHEDWMVVVTSNEGGSFQIPSDEDDHTVLSDPERNSFVIFYSDQYQSSFIDKPYTGHRYQGESVELYGEDTAAVNGIIPDDNGDYNFGDSAEFTIEMKIKLMPGPGTYGTYYYYYPSILSKRASYGGGVPGWNISLNAKGWQINFGQQGMNDVSISGTDISDGTWHDIAVAVVISGGHRNVRTYTDGNFNNQGDITNLGNINSPAPLTMGYLPGNIYTPADMFITDVKIWNTALDDATMGQISCNIGLPPGQPFSSNLIGFWPCTDGQGNIFHDGSTLQHNFDIRGNYAWSNFSDLICAPASSDLAVQMPQPVDIVRQILNWLQISPDPDWGLDGRVWTTNFVGLE
ncbi:MAG: DUF4983 domain-containing protein [Chitinophagaceae bacterium]|nr:MAG: DUF4983 domain-containing protein [Chitinophagaceae bacterium]